MNLIIPFFKNHIAALFILAISVIIGLTISGDYGIAWDEPLQRDIGIHTYDYLFKGDNTLNDFKNRDYGVAVELPLIFMEKALRLKDPRDIYRMRHLVVHLFFLFCSFAFYLLLWKIYRNRTVAIAGYLMLLLSPRIYAQSFYNSKDIPFMCMFILCFLFFAVAFQGRKKRYFLLFGILSGLLINIRIMGIMIPFLVSCLTLVDLITEPKRTKTLVNFSIYLALTVIVLIATWPWLWQDSMGHFRIALSNMSKFRWDNNILVNGQFIKASDVGWTYLPRWFGLTTPVVYLLLGITGFIALVLRFFRNHLHYLLQTNERNQLVYLACFAGPVISVIVLHSVLYDGWRQMYFIYPAFLLLAIYGISSVLDSRLFTGDLPKVMVSVLLIASLAGTGFTMIKSHPFEDVYFNILLPKKANYLRKTFELDYWGTSYKQALEYIVSHDHSAVLNIKVANLPGENNSLILYPADRKRIQYVESDDRADYFISNYRWHPRDYNYPKEKKIFSITIQNSEICSAWKLH